MLAFSKIFPTYHFPHGHQTPTHQQIQQFMIWYSWIIFGGERGCPLIMLNPGYVFGISWIDCWLEETKTGYKSLAKKVRLRKRSTYPKRYIISSSNSRVSRADSVRFREGEKSNWEPKGSSLGNIGPLDNHFKKKNVGKRHRISFPNTNTLRIP